MSWNLSVVSFTSTYLKNTKKPTTKSMHDLQQAILSATPTLIPCSAFETLNDKSLSILMMLHFLRHNSQRLQTFNESSSDPYDYSTPSPSSRTTIDIWWNCHSTIPHAFTSFQNLCKLAWHWLSKHLSQCNDPIQTLVGHFLTRSKLSLHERHSDSYTFYLDITPCQWDGSAGTVTRCNQCFRKIRNSHCCRSDLLEQAAS